MVCRSSSLISFKSFFVKRGELLTPHADACLPGITRQEVIDIARGDIGLPFSVPTASLEACAPADPGGRTSRAYLRFTVTDRPGVLRDALESRGQWYD